MDALRREQIKRLAETGEPITAADVIELIDDTEELLSDIVMFRNGAKVVSMFSHDTGKPMDGYRFREGVQTLRQALRDTDHLKGEGQEKMKRYTNVFVEKNGSVSVKTKLAEPNTLDQARAKGAEYASERNLYYLGVLNVDVTNAQLKRKMKKLQSKATA